MVRKKKEAVMETSNVGVEVDQSSLQKEIKILSRFLDDKNQIIEWTKIKLERMRLDFQRMQVNYEKTLWQNSKLALSNSNLLADLRTSKDKQRLLQHENGCKQGLLKVLKDQLIKEPNALSSSEPVTSNNSEPDSLCIKCDRGGNLLVCSEVICPLTCHMECLGYPPHFDSVGRFLCPYCAYKLVMLEVPKAEKEVVSAARKAISVFLGKQVVDDDAGGPVSEETDMVQGTDQNLTLSDAATSSALSELNGMLGNVSRKSDKGRDSHGEEETADRVELEPRENAQEKNPITLDSCQQTKVGVESGKPVEGIVDDSEVELEKITEGILNDTETEGGNPPTVDSRNKRMSHPRQIADLVRKMRNLGGEPEKDVEEQRGKFVDELEKAVEEQKRNLGGEHEKAVEEQRRNLGGETEKTVQLFDKDLEEEFKSRQSMYGRKRWPWSTEEGEMLKVKVLEHGKSCRDTLLKVKNMGPKSTSPSPPVADSKRLLDGIPEVAIDPLPYTENDPLPSTEKDLKVTSPLPSTENDVEEQRGNFVDEFEKAVEEQKRNLGGQHEKVVEEQRRNLGGETEKTVLERFKSRHRKKKCPWTTEEEEMLKEGVARFAKSNKNIPWKKILEFGRDVFHETRSAENLKDKWRA